MLRARDIISLNLVVFSMNERHVKVIEAVKISGARCVEKLQPFCHNRMTRSGKDFLMHELSGCKPALTQRPCGRASSSDIAIPMYCSCVVFLCSFSILLYRISVTRRKGKKKKTNHWTKPRRKNSATLNKY